MEAWNQVTFSKSRLLLCLALLETRPEGGVHSYAPMNHPVGHSLADASDLRRARSKVPRDDYRGETFGAMADALNQWLTKHAPRSQDCDKWTVHELQELQKGILQLRD